MFYNRFTTGVFHLRLVKYQVKLTEEEVFKIYSYQFKECIPLGLTPGSREQGFMCR